MVQNFGIPCGALAPVARQLVHSVLRQVRERAPAADNEPAAHAQLAKAADVAAKTGERGRGKRKDQR